MGRHALRPRVASLVLLAVPVLAVACSSDSAIDAPDAPDATFAPAPTTPGSPAPGSTGTGSTTPGTTPGSTAPATSGVPLGDPAVVLVEVAGIDRPVDLAWRRDDPTLFVATQDGLVVPVRDGKVAAPVLDMRSRTRASGERGLLGLAFHPARPLAYVDYTNRSGDTVIDEYAIGADGTFDPASRRQVLTIDQPYSNHNGGEVLFGPDGYLYIGTGDGGSGGDPERRALNVATLLGKILRIDPVATAGAPYAVPADNPFVGVAGAKPEIWSVGLRNPWRMSFDRATGDLWIGDVGQGEWEEIDVAFAADGGGRGLNFGWSAWEGTHRFNDDQPEGGAVMPIHEYQHGEAGCSISGGVRYRGAAIPELQGWYVYGDYCSGQVRALQVIDRVRGKELLIGSVSQVSAVTEGPDGELYVLSLDGKVSAVRPA